MNNIFVKSTEEFFYLYDKGKRPYEFEINSFLRIALLFELEDCVNLIINPHLSELKIYLELINKTPFLSNLDLEILKRYQDSLDFSYLFAILYSKGILPFSKDENKALFYCQRAFLNNQFIICLDYYELLIKKDIHDKEKLFKLLTNALPSKRKNRLMGLFLLKYNEDQQSKELAIELLKIAEKEGDNLSSEALGDEYEKEKDYQQAFKHYILGSNKGNLVCSKKVANYLEIGKGIEKDIKASISYYLLCENDLESQIKAAVLLRKYCNNENRALIKKILENAYLSNHISGSFYYGLFLLESNNINESLFGLKILEKISLNYPDVNYALYKYYKQKRKSKLAMKYLRKAIAHGDIKAIRAGLIYKSTYPQCIKTIETHSENGEQIFIKLNEEIKKIPLENK